MPNTKDTTFLTENLKIFLLGDYGTGKSVFASTCPTPGFLFDFDNRPLSYRGLDWDYESYEASGKSWVQFEKDITRVKDAVDQGKYKTAVLDSATAMTDVAMERALQIDPRRSDEGGPIWNVHYQIVRNLVEGKLHKFLSLNCNLVLIGHWKVDIDSKTGAILSIDPLLTGQLSTKVPGYFDEVYAAATKTGQSGTQYILRTVPRGLYKARSTISGPYKLLPEEIPNNYFALMQAMREARRKEAALKEEFRVKQAKLLKELEAEK
ncbi:MAG: AAA family ATPase [Anaerovoracaceae bacterium]